jgi:hypothetical protein
MRTVSMRDWTRGTSGSAGYPSTRRDHVQDALDTIHHFTTAFLLDALSADPVADEVLEPQHYADRGEALHYVRVRSNR